MATTIVSAKESAEGRCVENYMRYARPKKSLDEFLLLR